MSRQDTPENVEELGRDPLPRPLEYTILVRSAESFVLCSRTKPVFSKFWFSTDSLYLMSCHSALPRSQEMCDGNPGGWNMETQGAGTSASVHS